MSPYSPGEVSPYIHRELILNLSGLGVGWFTPAAGNDSAGLAAFQVFAMLNFGTLPWGATPLGGTILVGSLPWALQFLDPVRCWTSLLPVSFDAYHILVSGLLAIVMELTAKIKIRWWKVLASRCSKASQCPLERHLACNRSNSSSAACSGSRRGLCALTHTFSLRPL